MSAKLTRERIAGLLEKATPGPWETRQTEANTVGETIPLRVLKAADNYRQFFRVICRLSEIPCDVEESNAALIAAAPDLAALALRLAEGLKGLLPLVEDYRDDGAYPEDWQSVELRAALDSARSLLAELEG